jgi:hypothetical protein
MLLVVLNTGSTIGSALVGARSMAGSFCRNLINSKKKSSTVI